MYKCIYIYINRVCMNTYMKSLYYVISKYFKLSGYKL